MINSIPKNAEERKVLAELLKLEFQLSHLLGPHLEPGEYVRIEVCKSWTPDDGTTMTTSHHLEREDA